MRVLLALTVLWLSGCAASAEDYRAGALELSNLWSRATPKSATVGGGYLRIRNTGASADRLLGGSSEVSKRIEVHSMAMEGGVMRMREVKDGLEIKAGETVELKPGSYHLMFVGLQRPFERGQRVGGILRFEKAGEVKVEFVVQAAGAGAPGHEGAGH